MRRMEGSEYDKVCSKKISLEWYGLAVDESTAGVKSCTRVGISTLYHGRGKVSWGPSLPE